MLQDRLHACLSFVATVNGIETTHTLAEGNGDEILKLTNSRGSEFGPHDGVQRNKALLTIYS
jgi:hypothetical protein